MTQIVTEADREAAAKLMRDVFQGIDMLAGDYAWADTVERGEDDNYPFVRAFARHAATARAGALEEAAKWLREEAGSYSDPKKAFLIACLADAIEGGDHLHDTRGKV